MAKFKVGDKVVFKNDPEAKGSITNVEYDPKSHDEPVYTVKLGAGSELAEESELKISSKSLPNKGTKNMNDELNDASDGPEPYGAQVARRLHEDHSILMKDYDEMIGLLDHEGLKKHMTKTLEGLESNLTALEDLFSESYPHLKGLGEEEDTIETQDIDLEDDLETKDIDEDPLEGLDDDEPAIDDSLDDEDPLEGLDEDKDIGGDALPADSVNEDEDIPSPDEVVEGMATKRLKHKQKNLKSKKKSMDKDDDKEEKYLLAYRRKGVKSWVKKSFDDEDDRENFAKRLLKKAIDNDVEVDVMTKDPVADVKSHDDDEDDEIPSEMKRFIKAAADYLDEISEDDAQFDDEKRMKAYHHYKNFEEITGEEDEKAMPGSPEWEKEEMNEPEHKSKGWHKDMDEEDEDKKSLKLKRKAFGDDDEEDSEAVKMCKDCKSFLKSLAFEKAFGDQHREKAAYFKNALDSMDEEELGAKGIEDAQDETDEEQNNYIDDQISEGGKGLDEDEDLETKDLDEDDDETDMKSFDEDELDEDTMKALRKSFSQQEKTLNVLAKQINGIL